MNKSKEILVALAGNPNSGKTSLFNKLVGANQKVGNWSGVTVERYEGHTTHRGYEIKVIDLPGTYSLTTYSPEEIVAKNFLVDEKPDVVINVVDATNLERNLYLTTQLIDIQANLIVVLNMYDEVEANKTKIDVDHLETLLGAHLIPTSTTHNIGLDEILDHIVDYYSHKIELKKNKLSFSATMEDSIQSLADELITAKDLAERYNPRWLAIKLLANDKDVYRLVRDHPVWIKIHTILEGIIKRCKTEFNSDPEMLLREERNSLIRGAIKETVVYAPKIKRTSTEIIDSILLNRVTGLPIFAFFMWSIFQITFVLGEAPMGWIEGFFAVIGDSASDLIKNDLARSLIVDGVVAGVGGVVVFLPNILILFFALSVLEATGYMARAAFVIDKVMHKFGLHGKSFIPMITGFGCSVPAFMATRTLKSESDRITTLLIIPFMSCGAKFPVYVLITGAFFHPEQAGNVLFGIYLFGVLLALLSAKLLKSAVFRGESEPFVMELPPYRMPTFRSLLFQSWFKGRMYLRKAGTIILFASVLIWVASNYPKSEKVTSKYKTEIYKLSERVDLDSTQKENKLRELQSEELSEQLEHSFVGIAGKIIEPIVKPLGFDWRIGIALATGVAAKEIVVSTMGTLYALGDVDEGSSVLRAKLSSNPNYNVAVALSIMVFVLLYIPCFAASVVFHREAGRWKWTLLYIGYTMGMAWIMSFIVYNLVSWLFL